MLVGAQAAFSMVLVVTTALLLRGVYVAQTIDLGFDHSAITVATYDLRGFGYVGDRAAAFQRQLVERTSNVPGIEGVALAEMTPLPPEATLGITARRGKISSSRSTRTS